MQNSPKSSAFISKKVLQKTLIIEQMKASEGVTEDMKKHVQMAWVRAMNSIRNRAEEIILREMIYEEDAV